MVLGLNPDGMTSLLKLINLNTMNRTIGIILVLVGIISGVYAMTLHEKEKTLLNLGNIEIKKEDKAPDRKASIGYAVAIVSLIGGTILLSSKNLKLT